MKHGDIGGIVFQISGNCFIGIKNGGNQPYAYGMNQRIGLGKEFKLGYQFMNSSIAIGYQRFLMHSNTSRTDIKNNTYRSEVTFPIRQLSITIGKSIYHSYQNRHTLSLFIGYSGGFVTHHKKHRIYRNDTLLSTNYSDNLIVGDGVRIGLGYIYSPLRFHGLAIYSQVYFEKLWTGCRFGCQDFNINGDNLIEKGPIIGFSVGVRYMLNLQKEKEMKADGE
ncbi:MAG: hypothetical protein JNL57_00325 [Bacteroidetes bacterium]|nr:hypothetical protein [Bacteroidota bacterium]